MCEPEERPFFLRRFAAARFGFASACLAATRERYTERYLTDVRAH